MRQFQTFGAPVLDFPESGAYNDAFAGSAMAGADFMTTDCGCGVSWASPRFVVRGSGSHVVCAERVAF
jgi:hypothetical protein